MYERCQKENLRLCMCGKERERGIIMSVLSKIVCVPESVCVRKIVRVCECDD